VQATRDTLPKTGVRYCGHGSASAVAQGLITAFATTATGLMSKHQAPLQAVLDEAVER